MPERKKAFITGITGQDGSYLAELLLSKGYEVHGMVRRSSSSNRGRIDHIAVDPRKSKARFSLHYGDLGDSEQIANIIHSLMPDEIYHLGSQSHVRVSFDIPEYTGNVTGLAVTRILESVRRSGHPIRQVDPGIRFYQASSSEMFGGAAPPQGEDTPFEPRSPYACAKLYAYWMVRNYRQGYNLFATNGILFNHESPRRGETFVTRKITRGIASILAKREKNLYLGNLEARRDWGFAPEYVEAMWRILQAGKPDDFVIGTGEAHSVQEFLDASCEYAGLDAEKHVKIDAKFFRPTEVVELIANAGKAARVLGWRPVIRFRDLVRIMIDSDMRAAGLEPPGEGDEILAKRFPKRWWNRD